MKPSTFFYTHSTSPTIACVISVINQTGEDKNTTSSPLLPVSCLPSDRFEIPLLCSTIITRDNDYAFYLQTGLIINLFSTGSFSVKMIIEYIYEKDVQIEEISMLTSFCWGVRESESKKYRYIERCNASTWNQQTWNTFSNLFLARFCSSLGLQFVLYNISNSNLFLNLNVCMVKGVDYLPWYDWLKIFNDLKPIKFN